MNVKISLPCCFLFAAATAIALIGCNQDDGGSADDSADDDGGDDGCEYVFAGSKASSEDKGKPKEGLGECIPDNWPEGFDQEPVLAILEAYLGTYIDEDDAQRTITCNPAGIWSLPNDDIPDDICDHFWGIPIWVTFGEEDTTTEGLIDQHYPIEIASPPSWPAANMFFAKDDEEYAAYTLWSSSDILQWVFTDPENAVWTKVE